MSKYRKRWNKREKSNARIRLNELKACREREMVTRMKIYMAEKQKQCHIHTKATEQQQQH